MQEEFKTQEEKIAFVNQEITKGIEHIKQGDAVFNSMAFEKAKQQYQVACQIFINLLKMTTDDPNLQGYLNQQCTYAMNKAE